MKLLFRMKPQGAFYGGNDFFSAQDFPFPRSDTVFQALLSAWDMLWGKEEKNHLLSCFKNQHTPPFFMTSFFPVMGDVYFLPRPLALQIESSERQKKIEKAVSWISANIYKEWLEGKDIVYFSDYFLGPSAYFHSSELRFLEDLCPSKLLWSSDKGRMRNRLSVFMEKAQAYPAEQVYYSQNMEFYLIVEVEESYKTKLEAAFRFLAEEGIGGQRSIGCGSFLYEEPRFLPKILNFLEKPVEKNYVVLSLYYPQAKEKSMFHEAYWEIIERQGWTRDEHGQSRQNKAIRLLKEGSCFSSMPDHTKALIEVTPSQSKKETCYHYVYPFRVVAPGGKI